MPTYDTHNPIDLAINLQVGRIDVIASDRSDTVVTALPTNPTKANDRRGAEQTRVDFNGRKITITGPRPRIRWIGPNESVDLRVELPTGSRLTAEIVVGGLRTSGRLGATRVKCSTGDVDLDATGDLWLHVPYGSASVGSADGGIEITADYGQIRVGSVSGDAVLKASYGGILIEEAGGDVDAKLSYGELEITRALGSVVAKNAYGGIRLREVSGGSIEVESGHGQVAIGVRPGTPAWLDLSSKDGQVRSELEGRGAPDESERAVAVRVRAQGGDIHIQRAR